MTVNFIFRKLNHLKHKKNILWVGTINGVNRIQNGKSESIKELEGITINDNITADKIEIAK